MTMPPGWRIMAHGRESVPGRLSYEQRKGYGGAVRAAAYLWKQQEMECLGRFGEHWRGSGFRWKRQKSVSGKNWRHSVLKRNGYSLSDQQVREIKANMVQGVTLTALSRMYNVSVETLSRIRRGITYKHVRVLGEETLRPEIESVAPSREMIAIQSGVSDEEIEAQGKAMLEMQNAMLAEKAARKVVGEVEEMTEAEKMAANFLGNIPVVRRL